MTEYVLGFFSPWTVYALVLGLQALLPARRIRGYARDTTSNEPLAYKLNGLPVLLVVVAAWLAAGCTGLLPFDWLWRHRWSAVCGACVLGALGTARALRGLPPRSSSWLKDCFLGRSENPRMLSGQVDAKMYLYLAGATLLALNLLSFAAHHILTYPANPSPGVVVHVCLFLFFLLDYLMFERVHLYTYDLFAERLRFKLQPSRGGRYRASPLTTCGVVGNVEFEP